MFQEQLPQGGLKHTVGERGRLPLAAEGPSVKMDEVSF